MPIIKLQQLSVFSIALKKYKVCSFILCNIYFSITHKYFIDVLNPIIAATTTS